jgi:hypothetical protein
MRIAYLILSHKNPEQLRELINQLNDPNVNFFIHIDSKSPISEFHAKTTGCNAHITFSNKRFNGQWGDIGLVLATLELINEAKNCYDFDYYLLLSGMDYPIKSNEEIFRFFETNMGKSFIQYTSLPTEKLNYGGMDRIYGYSYTLLKKRQTYVPYSLKPKFNLKGHILNALLSIYSLPQKSRKNYKHAKTFYYGSQWWMLHKNAVKSILDFLDSNPDYLNFHKYTLIPDEIFFQTILLNHHDSKNLNIINNNYRFMVWEQNCNHPKFLGIEDFDSILHSSDLFARKFEENSEILKSINKMTR